MSAIQGTISKDQNQPVKEIEKGTHLFISNLRSGFGSLPRELNQYTSIDGMSIPIKTQCALRQIKYN